MVMKINKVYAVCSLALLCIIAFTVYKLKSSSVTEVSATVVVSDDPSVEPLQILNIVESGELVTTIVTNELPPVNSLLVIHDKGGTFNMPTLAKTSQPPVAPENPYLNKK